MTRYLVEYRRRSDYDNQWGNWIIYHSCYDEASALDAYARHVGSYPAEQLRFLTVEEGEPIHFFQPFEAGQEEAA